MRPRLECGHVVEVTGEDVRSGTQVHTRMETPDATYVEDLSPPIKNKKNQKEGCKRQMKIR